MKRLLSLCLCAILCIGMALPSLAESELTFKQPLTAEEYKQYFAAFINGATAGYDSIQWIVTEQDETLHLAVLDAMAPGIAFIQEGDLVDEVMFYKAGEVTDEVLDEVATLLYCTACPLLMREGYDVHTAAVMANETLMAAYYDGSLIQEFYNWYGVNTTLLVSQNEDGTFKFQFVMDFLPEPEAVQ